MPGVLVEVQRYMIFARKRHKGIPDSWIRPQEAALRLGISPCKITRWAGLGYYTLHRLGPTPYVCWSEMMENRLVRQQLERFHERIEQEEAADADKPLQRPTRHKPLTEPLFRKETK